MTRKVYNILDNGGRPFRVTVDSRTKSVHVSQSVSMERSYDNITYLYRPIPMEICYIDAFVPKEEPEGNSLLFLVDTPWRENRRYVYLIIYHDRIRTFETDEKILHFESPVNGSEVSSPLATSEQNYYFFNDMDYVPKHVLKHSRVRNAFDVYDAYYYYSKQSQVRHKMHNVRELCSNYKPCPMPYEY